MGQVAKWMKQAIDAYKDEKKLDAIHKDVIAFATQFPLPSDQ
jgi:glycine/serine hydroxymethyltransferase